jgi:hypothetical protein
MDLGNENLSAKSGLEILLLVAKPRAQDRISRLTSIKLVRLPQKLLRRAGVDPLIFSSFERMNKEEEVPGVFKWRSGTGATHNPWQVFWVALLTDVETNVLQERSLSNIRLYFVTRECRFPRSEVHFPHGSG